MGSDWLRIFEGHTTACSISSLRPGCAYLVRVRCANDGAPPPASAAPRGAPLPASPSQGPAPPQQQHQQQQQPRWGPWSAPVELTTQPDVPAAPGAPAIHEAGTVSATFLFRSHLLASMLLSRARSEGALHGRRPSSHAEQA